MIIFVSVLTTFDMSFIFWQSWGSREIWLGLKIETIFTNLACPNRWNTLYNKSSNLFLLLTEWYEQRLFSSTHIRICILILNPNLGPFVRVNNTTQTTKTFCLCWLKHQRKKERKFRNTSTYAYISQMHHGFCKNYNF
jgi:hypothetical protein